MTKNDNAIWQQVVATSQATAEISDALFGKAEDRVDLLRSGLHGNVAEIMTSLGLLSRLTMPERLQLFSDILPLCLSPKFAQTARAEIASMPREWVIAHIEESAEPLLRNADNLDYQMLLGLFDSLEPALAARLARRATLHDDFDVREVGQDYLGSRAP